MRHNRSFDEVMIVNPSPAGFGSQAGGQTMRFSNYVDYGVPSLSYYAEPQDLGYYGEPVEFGYYAEPEYFAAYDPAYGQYEPIGYYAEEYPMGYAEDYPLGEYYAGYPAGYYGEAPYGYADMGEDPYAYGEAPYGYAEDPYSYGEASYAYGEDPYAVGEFEPIGYYGEAMPEMVGYGEHEPFAENFSGLTDYGEQEFAGYMRDLPPAFNPGCPMPTNVAGVEEGTPLEGYIRPAEVSPTCEQFKPQPGSAPPVPDSFRPLW